MNFLLPALIVAALCVAKCEAEDREEKIPDIGPSMHQAGRPLRWDCSRLQLDDGFFASAGFCYYLDEKNKVADYYCVSIERVGSDASYTIFQRDIAVDMVPDEIDKRPLKDIVKYNPETRSAIIEIGHNSYKFSLPAP